jgi:hypothetical protein
VLHVTLHELPARRAQDVLAQQLRAREPERHGILQLVAEPNAPPGWYRADRAHMRQLSTW